MTFEEQYNIWKELKLLHEKIDKMASTTSKQMNEIKNLIKMESNEEGGQ